MPRRRRTPQEKKRLSLTRDRRNTYGQNAKASRKDNPRSKAYSHRKVRRVASSTLRVLLELPVQISDVKQSTLSLARLQKGRFRKSPDRPLGKVIARQMEGRQLRPVWNIESRLWRAQHNKLLAEEAAVEAGTRRVREQQIAVRHNKNLSGSLQSWRRCAPRQAKSETFVFRVRDKILG